VNTLLLIGVLSPDQRRNAPTSVPGMPPRQTSDPFSQRPSSGRSRAHTAALFATRPRLAGAAF